MTPTCPFCGAAEDPRFIPKRHADDAIAYSCGAVADGDRALWRSDDCHAAEVARLTKERDEAQQIAKKYEDRYFNCMERLKRLEEFANRFLHPEDLGFTVTAWIRDDAREALGMPAVETPRSTKP